MNGFRLDRFFTLHVFRLLNRVASRGSFSVPVLMYHSIADRDEASVPPYYRTCTHPNVFQEQMAYLKRTGCQAVDLGELVRLLSEGGTVPACSVVITFDDGFRDFHTEAFPVLEQYGFTATMFLPSGFVGRKRRVFKGVQCLSWSEVEELQRRKIAFGSHTVTHPRLYGLSWEAIRRELRDSKTSLENGLGKPVTTFAYPYAYPYGDRAFAKTFERLLQETGYRCNATTRIGRVRTGDNMFRLRRLPVNSCDDSQFFAAKIEGAYDWLAKPQGILKQIKRLASRRSRLGNSHG